MLILRFFVMIFRLPENFWIVTLPDDFIMNFVSGCWFLILKFLESKTQIVAVLRLFVDLNVVFTLQAVCLFSHLILVLTQILGFLMIETDQISMDLIHYPEIKY